DRKQVSIHIDVAADNEWTRNGIGHSGLVADLGVEVHERELIEHVVRQNGVGIAQEVDDGSPTAEIVVVDRNVVDIERNEAGGGSPHVQDDGVVPDDVVAADGGTDVAARDLNAVDVRVRIASIAEQIVDVVVLDQNPVSFEPDTVLTAADVIEPNDRVVGLHTDAVGR